MSANFHKTSYEMHSAHIQKHSHEVPSIIGQADTIDALRHRRMYRCLDGLILHDIGASWLTIGDAGGDAFYLLSGGLRNVTPSCIDISQLSLLRNAGILTGNPPVAVNAEQIGLHDNSVDYVLCKEAFHHMPRAPLAFYEMLRVARKAVALIEPAEPYRWGALDRLKVFIKTLIRGRSAAEQLFEPTGNFLFRLSEVEIKKQACALQVDSVAIKYMNDFYHSKLSSEPVSKGAAMALFRAGVVAQDLACALRLMNRGMIIAVVFKRPPGASEAEALRADGFSIESVPRNPYLDKGD